MCRRNNQKTRKRSWKLKTCLPYTLNLSLPLSFSLFLSCTHKLTLTNINYSFQTSCMNMFYGRRVIPGGVHYQIWKGFLVALSDEALRKPFSVERLILAHWKSTSVVRRNPWKWMGTLCSELLYLWRMKENRTVLTVWSLKPLWNNSMFSSIFLPEHWHLSDQLGRLDYIVWKNSFRGFWWIAPPAMQSLVENYGSKGTANSEHRDSLFISHFPDLREKWIWKWMSPGRECKSNLLYL